MKWRKCEERKSRPSSVVPEREPVLGKSGRIESEREGDVLIGPVRNENGSLAGDPFGKTRNKSHDYCITTIDKVYDKTVKNYNYRYSSILFNCASRVYPGQSSRNRRRMTRIRNGLHKEWRRDRRSPALNAFLASGRNERDEES